MLVSKLLVVAHRGASSLEPENTLRSIQRALEFDADFVEVDVRASCDGHLVLIHDSTVDRTTNGNGVVSKLTFNELRKLDAGFGERIPTLEESVELVKGKAKLVVEIKVPGIEKKIITVLKEYHFENEVIITSFIHPVVKHVKKLCPNIKTGVIFSSRPVKPANLALDAESEYLFPKLSYVDEELIQQCHEKHLAAFPWPVDTREDIENMAKLGADGIVTNKLDLVQKLISQIRRLQERTVE